MITGKTLLAIGWPAGPAVGEALKAAKKLASAGLDDEAIVVRLEAVRADPAAFATDPAVRRVAQEWVQMTARAERQQTDRLHPTPVPFAAWGRNMVDSNAVEQMENAARLPIARAGALMPDAHFGYGLPIGGVLATENAVIPYGVGVDIACRMRLTVFDATPLLLEQKKGKLEKALLNQTRFGAGVGWERANRAEHEAMDDPNWAALPLLKGLKDKAWTQLGTSGSGK